VSLGDSVKGAADVMPDSRRKRRRDMENLDDTPEIEKSAAPGHIHTSEPVHDGESICRLLCHRAAMNGSFEYAAPAIFIAIILDALDGRMRGLPTRKAILARNTKSVDIVVLRACPRARHVRMGAVRHGQLGWLAASSYTAGAGLRLARFNPRSDCTTSAISAVCPVPAAAALVVGFVWVLNANACRKGYQHCRADHHP